MSTKVVVIVILEWKLFFWRLKNCSKPNTGQRRIFGVNLLMKSSSPANTTTRQFLRKCPSKYEVSNSFTILTLRWRHNERDSVSNHQPHGCLFNGLLRCRSKKTSKLRVTGLCVGNSPGPVNSPHKGTVTRKMFPFDDVIMKTHTTCTKGAKRNTERVLTPFQYINHLVMCRIPSIKIRRSSDRRIFMRGNHILTWWHIDIATDPEAYLACKNVLYWYSSNLYWCL